ncbi:MAG: CDP-diacylglycerol--serine O-phosphatidyltransferase [Candidatus Kapabacteria bacterium]|nr:CDP-diacylglycerol--serine O-phosphatidyltransferase [Candidatus Kapabacteria bacterium]
MRITRSIVPNMLTLANLFCGFSSIIYFSNQQFTRGAVFILLAAIFDMLDGMMARLIKSASEFGVELDSLCDAVSFGVAPSFLLYTVYFRQFGDSGILLASLPALAGVSRLARFNVQLQSLEDKKYFKGMPIPAGALMILSYVIFYHLKPGLMADEIKSWMIVAVTIITSLIMISKIKHDNLPRPSWTAFKQRPLFFIAFFIALIAAIVSKGDAIFPIMIIYSVTSSIRHFIEWLRLRRLPEDDFTDSEVLDIQDEAFEE